VSAVRFISYKDLRIGRWRSQPLGVYLIALVGIAFFLAMTLFPQPYYWPTDAFYGDVPPLGSRAGWLGLACMPFIFAFGAKANLVSALTGVSSDKLIIWHSWVSWAMLVLAYTHAFPCIIYHQRKGDMAQTFRTGALWLTGVIALFSQTWLTLMSVTWIR
jgi:ferric-chelate reductase